MHMASDIQPAPVSKPLYWIGWVISILPVLMLLMSASMKLMPSEEVLEQSAKMGMDKQLLLILGIVELSCTIVYLFPWTAVLGAILLTGYLGGAICTHALKREVQFALPLLLGVLVWLGLFLRDRRIRALIPWRL
jgi:DoxX-like family